MPTPTVLEVVLQRPQQPRVGQPVRKALLLHLLTLLVKVMVVMVVMVVMAVTAAAAAVVEVEGKEVMGREVMVEGGEEGAIDATSFLATACISGEDH